MQNSPLKKKPCQQSIIVPRINESEEKWDLMQMDLFQYSNTFPRILCKVPKSLDEIKFKRLVSFAVPESQQEAEYVLIATLFFDLDINVQKIYSSCIQWPPKCFNNSTICVDKVEGGVLRPVCKLPRELPCNVSNSSQYLTNGSRQPLGEVVIKVPLVMKLEHTKRKSMLGHRST